jgi:hypothetical protein
MMPFLKLTPEACERMWYEILWRQGEKLGRMFPYQTQPKTGKPLGTVKYFSPKISFFDRKA